MPREGPLPASGKRMIHFSTVRAGLLVVFPDIVPELGLPSDLALAKLAVTVIKSRVWQEKPTSGPWFNGALPNLSRLPPNRGQSHRDDG